MAERRMFAKTITEDDHFMSLSSSAQALYLHLSMSADDDGFCNQVSIAMFRSHASVQDLEALLEKRYVYQFENGVIVIKHWRMANALRKDRYTPTNFKQELAQLQLDENGAYTWLKDDGCQSVADWLPVGCQSVANRLPQDSIGKSNIVESNLVEESKKKERKAPVVYFPDTPLVEEAFQAFIKMRKQIKAPMTDRAIELAIKKLEELSNDDENLMVKIIDQSTMNSWKSFYPLKEDKVDKEEKKISIVDEWMNA